MDVVIGRDLDLDDLYTTPDDGNRYEILDGAIVMSPPPGTAHQDVVASLLGLLREPARQLGLKALPAPVAWRISPGYVPEPDVIVASNEVISSRAVEGPPVLVIEVLSPSGRGRDLFEKRRIYAQGGASWYWIVDPAEPSLLVLRLTAAGYADEARVTGDDAYETHDPLAVRLVPADLIR